MNLYEVIFYSIASMVGGALTAWLWYLAAKSEPSKSPYLDFVESRKGGVWNVTYHYGEPRKEDEQKTKAKD